jgi:hypothetical protein
MILAPVVVIGVAAQEMLGYAQREHDRHKRLLSSGIVSRAQYGQALHALDNARQQVAGAEQHSYLDARLAGTNDGESTSNCTAWALLGVCSWCSRRTASGGHVTGWLQVSQEPRWCARHAQICPEKKLKNNQIQPVEPLARTQRTDATCLIC